MADSFSEEENTRIFSAGSHATLDSTASRLHTAFSRAFSSLYLLLCYRFTAWF